MEKDKVCEDVCNCGCHEGKKCTCEETVGTCDCGEHCNCDDTCTCGCQDEKK